MAIDRFSLVTRHNPMLQTADPYSPFTVGNGEFAFTADITGLQSFPGFYEESIPLCTQSQWGWHLFPLPEGNSIQDLKLKQYETYGRQVGYPTQKKGQEKLYSWLRENPHRLHLGRLGFRFQLANGSRASIQDLTDVHQRLDLWKGILKSSYRIEDRQVLVETLCHPGEDTLAISVSSELVKEGRLQVVLAFPYGSPEMEAADWNARDRHSTRLCGKKEGQAEFFRELDSLHYFAGLEWKGELNLVQEDRHHYLLVPTSGERFELVCSFTKEPYRGLRPSCTEIRKACRNHWKSYWTRGGAMELTSSSDPRAKELERRIILSQYLTAIQCGGSLPPQETGLICNSWNGKFHLEMHWWHGVHFALWSRTELLENSLWWYTSIQKRAEKWAENQGYEGARWPKMVGPEGRDSPSPIGPLLIWQQPHPIVYAELCYRAHPDTVTLQSYSDLVFKTAQFMASYATYIPKEERYVLGPPLIPAQENHRPEIAKNPTFELEYWDFGLRLAQRWRKRMGLPRKKQWDRVIEKLSSLPQKDGVYLAHENCPDTFTGYNRDHPSMLAAFGLLPGRKVEPKVMKRTLDRVCKGWRWEEKSWGWDYPMAAMTAARLNEPSLAVDLLLMDTPRNRFLPNGCNWQRIDLPVYLPGNGGLLLAAAAMAVGWDQTDTPQKKAPGFPDRGWSVVWEGLNKWF